MESRNEFSRKRSERQGRIQAILGPVSAPPVRSVRTKAPSKKKVKSEGESAPVAAVARPTRMSARLAGAAPEDENAKRKLEATVALGYEDQRSKRARVADDLDLSGIGLETISLRGALPGVRTFTDEVVRRTADKDLKALRERMSGLELYEKWTPNEIKITPQRVYALGFHPLDRKPLIFAGDKEGFLGVFDASQDMLASGDDDEDAERPGPVISSFKIHARTITSFAFSNTDANAVYSSSYDSSIRRMDLEKTISVQVYAPPDAASDDGAISALDVPSDDPNLLFFTTLDGYLGRHDVRDPESGVVWPLTDGIKIGGFSLHPACPHLVATASLDRTVKIWDLRKMVADADLGGDHPALIGEHASRLSVSHASWSSGGHLATSSYDNTVKLYSFPKAGSWMPGRAIADADMEPAHIVQHNNQTGRWVTILKPQWQRAPTDGIQKFVIGNMNRFVDVFGADGEQLAQLGGDGISAVPAVAHMHPTMEWVAGGTASGKLCLWM